MNEAVFNLLMAVLTAAVTALSAFVAAFVKKKGEQAAAETNSTLLKNVIEEVTGIVDIAVSAVSQTYVDELKKAGSFDAEAQKQALAMALAACIKAISPAAKAFIEETYGALKICAVGPTSTSSPSRKKAVRSLIRAACCMLWVTMTTV